MRALAVSLVVLAVGCSGKSEPGKPSRQDPPVKGSTRMVYSVDLDQAVDDRLGDIRRELVATLPGATITGGLDGITVAPAEAGQRAAVAAQLAKLYGDNIVTRDCEAVCFTLSEPYAATVKRAALAQTVTTIQARLAAVKLAGATVSASGEQLVVTLPPTDSADKVATVKALIPRVGKLEFKVVDDGSAVMRGVYAHVGAEANGAPTDPAAIAAEIRGDLDQWRAEDGAMHADYYLVASDREERVSPTEARRLGCLGTPDPDGQVSCVVTGRVRLDRYVQALAQTGGFAVPADRQLAYELVEPDGARPYWRSYLVERTPALTGAAIASARVATDPGTERPIVLLDFSKTGGRTFGDLTARIVGHKLAVVLDDRITSAPIIMSAIRGGRASVAIGGDPRTQDRDAQELATVLSSGALPAPLRLETVDLVE